MLGCPDSCRWFTISRSTFLSICKIVKRENIGKCKMVLMVSIVGVCQGREGVEEAEVRYQRQLPPAPLPKKSQSKQCSPYLFPSFDELHRQHLARLLILHELSDAKVPASYIAHLHVKERGNGWVSSPMRYKLSSDGGPTVALLLYLTISNLSGFISIATQCASLRVCHP